MTTKRRQRNRGAMIAGVLRGELKVRDPGPSLERWEHAGLVCYIRGGPVELGFYNGYVTVPADHPAFGQHYDKLSVDVHGGLTYGELEPEGWVLGFDTGHAMDVWPGAKVPEWMQRLRDHEGAVSWDMATLRAEVNRLAEQLAEMR